MKGRILLSAFAAAALTACGSGGSHSALPAAPAQPAQKTQASATFSIRIPAKKSGTQYVSASTQSVAISEGSTSLGTFNTTPTSPNCAPNNGSTQCSFVVGLSSGGATFTVNAYDAASGGGTLLSTGSVTQTIVAGENNLIPLTMSGIVTSIAVATGAAPNAGTAASVPVIVMAKDPDGNVIIGPGNYNVPITLTNSDASGAATLSTTSVNGPGTQVTLNYSGAPLSKAIIGASATGVPAGSVTDATFAPVPTTLNSFNLPRGGDAIAIAYNAPPTGDGNLWFTTDDNLSGAADSIDRLTPSGTITEFTPGVAPSTGLSADADYLGIAAGPDGNLWMTEENNSNIAKITPSGVVTEIGTPTAGAKPNRILVGPDGALWFTETSANKIARIPTTATSSTDITETALTGGTDPEGLVLGKDGNIYVAMDGSTPGVEQVVISGSTVTATNFVAMAQFNSSQSPGRAPAATDFPAYGIAQSSDGDLWVTNSYGYYPDAVERVEIGSPFSASVVTPFYLPVGGGYNTFMTATPDNSVWFASDDFPYIGQIAIPANHGNPTFEMYGTPIPNGYPEGWDLTQGPNGTLWMTNDNQGGNVVEFAY